MKNQTEQRVLYTIRLEPSVIKKIEAQAAKLKITHAAHTRNMLNICVEAKHERVK